MYIDIEFEIWTFFKNRLSISPRKQLWIKAVKKLTSERLGRESLAAWEESKARIALPNNDHDEDDENDEDVDRDNQESDERTKKSSDASADTEVGFPDNNRRDIDKEGK